MNVIGKLLSLSVAFSFMACASARKPVDETPGEIVVVDKPIIKSYKDAPDSLKKLKHSVVRVKTGKSDDEAISTGFFYKTTDVLVTSLHSFDASHDCRKKNHCRITVGLVENDKLLNEHDDAEVILREPRKT